MSSTAAKKADPHQLRLQLMDERKSGRLSADKSYQLALAAADEADPDIDRVLVEYYADRGVDLRDRIEVIAVRLKPQQHQPQVVRTGAWERGPFVDVNCPQRYSCYIRFLQRRGLSLPVKDILTGIQ